MRHNPLIHSPVLALALLLVASPALAQKSGTPSCTDQYLTCLNDTWDLREPFRTLADIECGLEYAGCVARKAALVG